MTPPLKMVLKGLGAAGRARLNALHQNQAFQLAGIVSRRPEVASLSWEEALADPQVDAIAISTESTDHPGSVEQALKAGKHVLCDFPLAFRRSTAQKLFQLAKEKNRILHVEHIGLLTQDHLQLKSQALAKGPLIKGNYLFQGGLGDKLMDKRWTGPLPILAISRLLQVADIWGAFQIVSQELKIRDPGFYLHLHLKFENGGVLGFTEERMPGLPRRRSLVAQCQGGKLHWKAKAGGGGLFAKDLDYFGKRALEGQACYYDENLMLGVLGQLERLY